MKRFLKKTGDVLWVLFLIAAVITHFLMGYALLGYLGIGADNS